MSHNHRYEEPIIEKQVLPNGQKQYVIIWKKIKRNKNGN